MAGATPDGPCVDTDKDGVCDDVDKCPGEDDDLDADKSGKADCLENILKNGQVATAASDWTADTNATAKWASKDAQSNAASGSLEVVNASPDGTVPTFLGATQCRPLTVGKAYTAFAQVFIPANQGLSVLAQFVVQTFTTSDCTGGGGSSLVTGFVGTADQWVELERDMGQSTGSSVRIQLVVRKHASGNATAFFDNILVREK